MTLILQTQTGTTQVNHITNLVEAIEYVESFGHICTGEYERTSDTIEFDWDFEDTGPQVVRNITVTVDGVYLVDFCQAGDAVPAVRAAAKRLAKQLKAEFVEITCPGMAAAYRSALAINNNQNR